MRSIIYKYMRFVYETEPFAEENGHGFYSIDESLIGHKYGKHLWLIGAINNANKDFRIECVFQRDSNSMETFIKKYIPLLCLISFILNLIFLNIISFNYTYIHLIL